MVSSPGVRDTARRRGAPRRTGYGGLVLAAAAKRVAGVLAVFAVVFAPAASDIGPGHASDALSGTDLSGAVLAPTFASSELAIGRPVHDVADDEGTTVAGHQPGGSDVPPRSEHRPTWSVAETIGATHSSAEAWSSRAPPAS